MASNAIGDPAAADSTFNSLAFEQETLVKRNSEGVDHHDDVGHLPLARGEASRTR